MPRLLFASLLLAAAVAIGLVVHDANSAQPGASGTFPIVVEGPDGTIFNGSVEVDYATAFTVLRAAADEGGFALEATGSGSRTFVESIAGYANDGAAGWCYAVWEDGWTWPSQSAGTQPLEPGQGTLWRYESGGCAGLG